MKIIENNEKKVTILLDEQDEIMVSSLGGSEEGLTITRLNSSIHIDELPVSKIKEKSLEEKEIQKMKDYLKTHRNLK